MGIEMLTIDPTAAQDITRKKLFIWLGAKTIDYGDICKSLLRHHGDDHPPSNDTLLELLLNHAQYVYNVPFGQRKMTGLQRKVWVIDRNFAKPVTE